MSLDKADAATLPPFAARTTVEQVEEGAALAPKFDHAGLIPCITTDAVSGEVLMLGHMNDEALKRTIATGEAHYFSRSRQCLVSYSRNQKNPLIPRPPMVTRPTRRSFERRHVSKGICYWIKRAVLHRVSNPADGLYAPDR